MRGEAAGKRPERQRQLTALSARGTLPAMTDGRMGRRTHGRLSGCRTSREDCLPDQARAARLPVRAWVWLFVAVLCLALTSPLRAQASPYVPLDDPRLPLLEHLIARGDIDDPSPMVRPFRRADAAGCWPPPTPWATAGGSSPGSATGYSRAGR